MPNKINKILNLTEGKSYPVATELGQGSLSIGVIGADKKKFDVLVDESLPINWECFNNFFTGFGKLNPEKYPYGDWPRLIRYHGKDIGFIKWSEKRAIEDFHWQPLSSINVDFTKAKIGYLHLILSEHPSEIVLGKSITRLLAVSGNLNNLSISNVEYLPSIFFQPTTTNSLLPYQLPSFPDLKDMTNLDVAVNPAGQPFDCKSLLQFKSLKYLNLSGNLINLSALVMLQDLTHLGLRYVPNLDSMPNLESWEKLSSFIGWNIEETKGKTLRREANDLMKKGKLESARVTQLRKAIWFTTEYAMPFSNWSGKNAQVAIREYKNAVKKLKKAEDENSVKIIIEEFTECFNQLQQIETSEREDLAEAIDQLIRVPNFLVCEDKAMQWFNSKRDY